MTSRVLPIGIIFDLCIPIGGYTHHQEDSYPDSKQFKPERFLEQQFSPTEFVL
ncbi:MULTISPECIES: cytochrome P450 [Nostocales]|uniref:Cytochrome P450 n=1 Tax=Dolichospermum flos-aquae UHCC 0037 TaxID=2590026 RepID=A0ACC7SC18_DOLFA|nr:MULTISPECIES: cytochrome P450 [Nostocales]MBO1064977.1 cytochrome P450 [Anabaena sp. 54]MTJ45746.1 cytochrome P450 [Dolichospermum flos-aquae UHCC 0037]